MIEFISQHQFGIAAAIYWIYSAAVSALPDPVPNGNPAYLWLYRFSHTIAGNITTVFGSRIPGLKILGLVVVIPLLMVSATSCSAHYTIHPGALNQTDSSAYDALLIAETTIDQARLDLQAGQLLDEAKTALAALIRSYNLARATWLTYRGAIATNVPSQVYFDQLTQNLSDLTDAIRKFQSVGGPSDSEEAATAAYLQDSNGGPDANKKVKQE